MLLGLALLYVGAVLFLNGLWLLKYIGDNEIAMINFFGGGITALVALYSAFAPGATLGTVRAGALTLLFTFTYLWVAFNRYNGADGRGLGWFCLFVALTAVPVTISNFAGAASVWGVWFGICWALWGILWFMYFLLLALSKPIARPTGLFTAFCGIFTGWVPGYLLLSGTLK